MEILAIIPARGGSKGLPRKNIRILRGKPLIAYSIEAALKSRYINRILVSTEDGEIAKISRRYGVAVINRPEKLARDNSSVIDTVKHSLESLEKKGNYIPDIVVMLQPTSPLRTTRDIDNAIRLFSKKNCDSVVSVCQLGHSPLWSVVIKSGYLKPFFNWHHLSNKRRQDLPKIYTINGAIYITTIKKLYKYNGFFNNKTIPYVMPPERSVDIDEEVDFKLAQLLSRYG